MREAARLTLHEGAAAIQRSAATLSRLENGRSVPRLIDVRALIEHYERREPLAVTDGTRERVLRLADIGHTEEWFNSFRDVIASDMISEHIQRLVGLESDASGFRSFEPDLVPGLLQTRAYATAMTRLFFPRHTPQQRDRFVQFRLARQHVLNREHKPLKLDVVIGEAAFRRVVGSPGIMRDQIEFIVGHLDGGHPNLRIRIAPTTLSVQAIFGGPFVIMEFTATDAPELVYVESRTAAHYLQNNRALEYYGQLFEELDSAVLTPDQSRRLLLSTHRALR